MLLPRFFALVLAPVLASAAIFPTGTKVKLLDAKGFRQAMKENRTSLVAFVAPWCGHCQRMAPEYSKAAKSLDPLVPFYAVDCDDSKNKNLCADQGVQGFPTLKLFPRGNQKNPVVYPGERTASAFVDYVSRRIPHGVKKLSEIQDILNWVYEDDEVPRVLLLTNDKRIPTMWKVLSNRFSNINFGVHRDKEGFQTLMLGVPEGTKVIVYGVGSNDPTAYEGSTKYEALSQYFESVLDGTAVLGSPTGQDNAQKPKPDGDRPIFEDGKQATFDEDFGEWHEMRQKLRQKKSQDPADTAASSEQSTSSSPSTDIPESTSGSAAATSSSDNVASVNSESPLDIETEAKTVSPETETQTTEEQDGTSTAVVQSQIHTLAQEQPDPSESTTTSAASTTEGIATPTLAESPTTETHEQTKTIFLEDVFEEECEEEEVPADEEVCPDEEDVLIVPQSQTETSEAHHPTDEL